MTNIRKARKTVSDVISKEDIMSWTPETPVIILSGTGTGKSFFIKNKLYEIAKNEGERILMLLHRINCVSQFKMEIKAAQKRETIKVDTYQKIQHDELYNRGYDLESFRYITCDEFHYFISDAGYNNETDISFEKIMSMQNAVKIFMSATGEDVAEYIRRYSGVEPRVYKLDLPKLPIGHLTFFQSDSSIKLLARAVIESGEKGVFFINSVKKAYDIYKEFSEYAVFNCAQQHRLHERVDDGEIEKILKEEKFEKPLLITSACMDAGVNLIDPALKHIVVDIPDVGSLIQCIGRKRSQSDDDRVDVYVKSADNRLLGRRKGRIVQSLRMADFLRDHDTDEYLQKFPRQYDPTGIVYDARVNGNRDHSTKRVNELMYRKRELDIQMIDEMIAYGDYGYCKYIARILGKYDPDREYYDYAVMKGDGTLADYLDAHVDQVMLSRKDREDLIRKMNVKRDGKRKHSREILNAALKEDNLPYRIEEFETSRMVNGKKKNYKSAWRIVRHDWTQ